MPVPLEVAGPDADQLVGLVHGPVEKHVVIGHVDMAVVVDPLRFDAHHRGDEGGEEHRFQVGTVEHCLVRRKREPKRKTTTACAAASTRAFAAGTCRPNYSGQGRIMAPPDAYG